ncbi:MAG: alpha/beta hydrolase [Phycisphaeraceae bacterium]
MPAAAPVRRRRHWTFRMLVYVLIAVMLWALAVWFVQRAMLFPRHLANRPPAIPAPADAEAWWLDTPAGRVEAWLLPGEGASADAPRPAVIFAHGNGERIDFWPAGLERYRDMGVTVLLPEYRGYGRSAGKPTAAGILDDFVRFRDRLAARDDVDADRIIYHGRSLGGAVLGSLAKDHPPAAMVLESSFSSTIDVARRYFVPGFMVRDRFDAVGTLRDYPGPVLLLHGRHDSIIPPSHAQRMHDAARHSELVWFDTNHNDVMPEGPYWEAIETFLGRAGLTGDGATR